MRNEKMCCDDGIMCTGYAPPSCYGYFWKNKKTGRTENQDKLCWNLESSHVKQMIS